MSEGIWTIRPCPHRQASGLAKELGLSEITASVLVRRGYGDPEKARAFLAGEQPLHDPLLLGDMAVAVERIRAAIAAGKRICVHGDYDVDGICATVLAVLVLRELGADVDWHLPSRFDEGYGVSGATRPSDYPFPELCGTGVAYKLGQALLGADSEVLRRHLDLVGLATIADVVPLLGENRSLVIAGLRALARTQKPGLQALMKVAHVDPAAVDTGQIGFRLAPRINAAGRLGHPRAALELLLTEDADEARRLADRLEELNRDRQAVEDKILRAAIAQVEEWPEAKRRRKAYVVWGDDWHEGVIGIVASRLVERYNRPVVLLAGGDGPWSGSGRSISSFDLHRALRGCSHLRERFGGHRGPAGRWRLPEFIDTLAPAFGLEAEGLLTHEDLMPTTVGDAVLPPGGKLTFDLREQLSKLAPFVLGNPDV